MSSYNFVAITRDSYMLFILNIRLKTFYKKAYVNKSHVPNYFALVVQK